MRCAAGALARVRPKRPKHAIRIVQAEPAAEVSPGVGSPKSPASGSALFAARAARAAELEARGDDLEEALATSSSARQRALYSN